MSRWTVFDEAAAAAARERGGQIDLRTGDDAGPAVSEALEQNSRVVAVFPTRTPGKVVVLRVQRRAPETEPTPAQPKPAAAEPKATPPQPIAVVPKSETAPEPQPAREKSEAAASKPPAPERRKREGEVSYAAGGFLGLSDELVLEPEEPPKPKKWWQRLLD